MPERSDKLKRLNEEAGQYELPYISKSRIKQWMRVPEHFRLKYLEDIREPETEAMRRGTDIHETFEHYYEQHREAGGSAEPTDMALLPERSLWADYVTPYISNFLVWEDERWREAGKKHDHYLPLAVEEEIWVDDGLLNDVEDEPPWMGIADVILRAESVVQVPQESGAVIIDFKTGKVPDEQYRDEGIYTELEYYAMLFEQKYDVVAVGAYYPKEHELLVEPAAVEERRSRIRDAAAEMIRLCDEYDGTQKFEAKESPLCKWGPSSDEQSAFYGVCSQCTWGKPANNEETFVAMLDEGYSYDRIADELGCSKDAVNYWRYKLYE